MQNPRKSVFFIFCKESEKKFRNCFSKFFKIRKFQIPKNDLKWTANKCWQHFKNSGCKTKLKKTRFFAFFMMSNFWFQMKSYHFSSKTLNRPRKNWYTGSFQYKKFQWKCVSSFIQFWYNSPPLRYDARDKNIFFSFLQINGSPTGKFWWLKQI